MKPARVEWNIGVNNFGQPLRLIYERGSDSTYSFTLFRDQADQRDDSAFVMGLTRQNIADIAQAVSEHKS